MKKIAIIGAGISGLFIANLFKKNPNYQITIYEKNTSVALEEGYGVQLSINSIKILNEIGFKKLENNEKFNPDCIWLNARIAANSLYESNGFSPLGNPFEIKSIGTHQCFIKILSNET